MMKKLLFALFFISIFGYAQFNELSPWEESLRKSKTDGEPLKMTELKAAFDEYWKTHDKYAKGSGYKPFMRYVNHFEKTTDENGTIQTGKSLFEAFLAKQKLKSEIQILSNLSISNWQSVGPFSMTNTGSWSAGSGRVNIIEVDPNNSTIWYMGTPAGGLWKSTNSGNNWLPLTDQLPQIGVSGIAIDPTNSNIIYIATGDKDAGDTPSVGVFKSTNGGQTWFQTGLSYNDSSRALGDLVINPNNPNQLYAAASTGILMTLNGGTTWTNQVSGNFRSGNIRFKANDPNTVFAVSSNGFFRSTNGGTSFTRITNGMPATASRIVMDVTAADPNMIYVLCHNNATSTVNNGFTGIYRSSDGGTSFELMNSQTNVLESNQAWFDLAICVSPTNSNLVFTGCLNIWTSTDGGGTLTKLNNWNQPTNAKYTHADIHYLGYKGNTLFCGSDGGIYFSNNNGQNFTDKTASAQIGQFYKISVSPNSDGKMVGGLQDNGGYGFSNNTWKNWYGADGMDNAINPTNDNIFYGFIQNGTSMYISTNAANARQGFVASPGAIEGNWVTPMVINSSGQLFSGFNALYKLSGVTSGIWEQQSTNVFSSNITDISIHPANNDIMYVAVLKELYKSINNGADFALVQTFTSNITCVSPHQTNVDNVYVTTSATTGNRVFRSTNGGLAFENISQGLPSIAVNVIRHHKNHINDALYLGTALGVYYRDNLTNSFVPFDTNLPNVAVEDLEVFLPSNKLIAATYGRGVWTTNLIMPLSTSKFDQANVAVYPNPFTNEITVKATNEIPVSIKIYDFSGKLVAEKNNFSTNSIILDTRNFCAGIYLMKIEFESNIVTRKIIKD